MTPLANYTACRGKGEGVGIQGIHFLRQVLAVTVAIGLSACAKAPPAGAPVAVSITPSKGEGATLNFSATYADAQGAGNIKLAGVLINDVLNGANGCYVIYLRPSKILRLVEDVGIGSLPLPLDSQSKVENSQCILYADGSSVTQSGNELTVKAAVTFKPKFSGTKDIYLYAENLYGGKTPLVPAKGSWVVP